MTAEEKFEITGPVLEAWNALYAARKSIARWRDEEKRARDLLYGMLGYADGDPKPQPLTAVSPMGEALFQVDVSQRRTLDTRSLRTEHPDVYALYERTTAVKTIRAVGLGDTA